MSFTISGYSTALFSTWYFIEEAGILFDCGDGCTASLLQKSRKVKHVFISHADRDHLTGLLQFCQLNNREEYPKLYFPADCGSFPALHAFSSQFDPHVETGDWKGIKNSTVITISKDLGVTAIRNNHVPVDENCYKSLGYILERTKKKLKPEYTNLASSEIAALRKTRTEDELTYTVKEKLIGYSGDTPVENADQWDNTDILIHEATFLNEEDMGEERPGANKHSLLKEVIAMVATIKVNHLVLGHFSSRYKEEEITTTVQQLAHEYGLKCAVYVVLPGVSYKNVLAHKVYESRQH